MKKLLLFSLFALLASAMGWAATETWKKVKSQKDLTDGYYLIVYESENFAFDGNLTTLDKNLNTQSVNINNDETITTTNCNFYFTIASNGSNYTIQSESGYYIGNTKTENGFNSSKTEKYTNTITFSGSNVSIASSGGPKLQFYTTTKDKRFRYYKSTQKPIALYKKQEGTAPQPTPTQVAALEINPGFGTIEVGTKVTISCATEGAVLSGTFGALTLENQALPYNYTVSEVGELKVAVKATQEGLKDSELLSGTFKVKAAVPVRDVITPKDLGGKGSYTDVKNVEKGGAKYKVAAYVTTNIMQFNKGKNAGLVMTTAQAAASKLIITWNKKEAGKLEIYGKNTPYSAITDLNNNEGELIETVSYSADGTTTVDLGGNYTFIGIKPVTGVSKVTSFEFIWNEGAAGGADVTYTKASEAKAGNFAVLATATADGKAVGRNAALSPVNVKVSDDAIGLAKGQTAIDEFEIVEKDAANKTFQLCGGLSSDGSRRFLTYNAEGLTTTAATVTEVNKKEFVSTDDVNADVTFVSTEAGLLVKFKDGQYLMFNGTNFIKADNGGTLTPVIVFMSSSNVSTGVETVEFDENAEAQYFNLNGVQVKAENLTPGLYIVRQGNKVSKQVIR